MGEAAQSAELLGSLRDGYRAAVFGASGGIGAALCSLIEGDARCDVIYAGARQRPAEAARRQAFAFDLRDEDSIAAVAAEMKQTAGELDLVIIATGILHEDAIQPEKSMRALSAGALSHAYAINAIGPALIVKHVAPLLRRETKSVIAALSARVGSIGDNRLGGWHAYRASKAALNQLIRTCAIEIAAKNKNALCVTLHPGTVATELSAPFQRSVAPENLFDPQFSASRLIHVIDDLSPAQSGQFFAWDGQPIAF
ncbi:MAG: SDR family NAD(P)-dependent oxidoreductase [Alphaproteobacteria bacterium]|nr:SDR family NAD(P)-dependent oxidoreductase [Alphaproteobacteria bacterium]